MRLPIIIYGNKILRENCIEVREDYPELHQLITNMFDTIVDKGVGLAAPQIGKNLRLFIITVGETKEVFINPKIIHESERQTIMNEGCLSIPGIYEDIIRPANVEVEYFNEKFELNKKMFFGMEARVIQHEYDHIDGKLFIDRLKPFKRELLKNKLKKIIRQ